VTARIGLQCFRDAAGADEKTAVKDKWPWLRTEFLLVLRCRRGRI
jgi:hypothetical protein